MSVTIINKQVNLDAAKRELISGALPDGSVLVTGKRQYTIQGVLGAGGFGIAYRATAPVKTADGYISRTFAIKEYFKKGCFRGDNGTTMRFAPNMTTEMNTGLKDFLTEAKRLKEISGLSANIVYVDEVFEANDTAYYAMEYLDGGDLERRVKHNGALSEGIALSLLIPIAKAVALLHEKHLLHLDIKPDNIVMKNEDDGSQHPVLIDFGIAKHFDKKGKPTSNLVAKGATDGYAPMEQYTDITTFAPEIDVYALGATLYFLLSGKQPPKSFDITPEIIEQNLPESVSARTRAAIVHALNRMKERRTPTVAAFLSELRTTYTLPLGYVLSTPEGAFRILEVTGETDCSIRYRAIPASAGAIDGALPRQPRGGKATDTIQGAVVIDELYIKGSQRADDGIFLPETDRWLNHFNHSTGPFPPAEVFAFIKMVDDATAAGDGVITTNANGTRYLIRKPTTKPSPIAKIIAAVKPIAIKAWKPLAIAAAAALLIYGTTQLVRHCDRQTDDSELVATAAQSSSKLRLLSESTDDVEVIIKAADQFFSEHGYNVTAEESADMAIVYSNIVAKIDTDRKDKNLLVERFAGYFARTKFLAPDDAPAMINSRTDGKFAALEQVYKIWAENFGVPEDVYNVDSVATAPQEETTVPQQSAAEADQKQQEADKKAEEARKAEEKRKQEEARKAEEKRKQEEARKAEEQRKQEEARKAEEQRKQNEAASNTPAAKLKKALSAGRYERAAALKELADNHYAPAYYPYAKSLYEGGNYNKAREYCSLSISAGQNVAASKELINKINQKLP